MKNCGIVLSMSKSRIYMTCVINFIMGRGYLRCPEKNEIIVRDMCIICVLTDVILVWNPLNLYMSLCEWS